MIMTNVCVDTGYKCIGSLRNSIVNMFMARDWNHGGYIEFLEDGDWIGFSDAFMLIEENLGIKTGEDLNNFFRDIEKDEDKNVADEIIEDNLYWALFPDPEEDYIYD